LKAAAAKAGISLSDWIRQIALRGIHVKRDNLVSVQYPEELNSITISATHQSTERRHGLWAKSVGIFNALREHGTQSIRRLADRTGLSKSSVHRHLQAIGRRDRYLESSLWETEAGRLL
jgi:hypothetical protein